MNKKKLKYIIEGLIILISIIYIDLSFSRKETVIIVENVEALAENEVDIFELCKKTGGHCMVSITQNILGICIDRD